MIICFDCSFQACSLPVEEEGGEEEEEDSGSEQYSTLHSAPTVVTPAEKTSRPPDMNSCNCKEKKDETGRQTETGTARQEPVERGVARGEYAVVQAEGPR